MTRTYKNSSFMMQILFILLILNVACSTNNPKKNIEDLTISINTSANSWVKGNPAETRNIITDKGIENWKNPDTKIRTYFKTTKTGILKLGLKAINRDGNSQIKISFNGVVKTLELSKSDTLGVYYIGDYAITKPGYIHVELSGISKTSNTFGEVTEILVGGDIAKDLFFVKDDFYWGRRGPSVHLNFKVPDEASDVVYFYNEMTIPKDNDVIGSYFMANGFGEGYFGIQVNSKTERRILFSVWSPFKTDDPSKIPENQKIKLLAKGNDVITAEFGNEGSGGQSRRVFNWKADVTYKFLIKVEPSVNSSTDYTAYFYAPEIGEWQLIASFRRPMTETFLIRPHSFLENFITEMGDETRRVYYSNQWVYDTNGLWHELTKAKFTADATARKESRLDYVGGIKNNDFFLQNCGFLNEQTEINNLFQRKAKNRPPSISFDQLDMLSKQ